MQRGPAPQVLPSHLSGQGRALGAARRPTPQVANPLVRGRSWFGVTWDRESWVLMSVMMLLNLTAGAVTSPALTRAPHTQVL